MKRGQRKRCPRFMLSMPKQPMSLRQQILNSPETLSDLAWAAEQRYLDGEALLESRRLNGAVYLFGFACEMWLKLVCLRLRGQNAGSQVRLQLAPARHWMDQWLLTHGAQVIPHEAYHSLRFWAEMLILIRSAQGNPLPHRLAGQLRHHVAGRMFDNWTIDLRYSSILVSDRDAWRVYNDTVWMRQTWLQFGR